ncbi:Uncharacterised protein [Yersinia rohdei]|uniref:hypothetical protein n=1 Tax=Yersinia rohdei TaxID=29485 RepID=UPI0005E462FF|nr:hypothetical protein [Yersinia rohdei]CNJ55336.1 Uncharacterised protein [Yersinia rohdei]
MTKPYEPWEAYEEQFIREVAEYMPGDLIAEKLERSLRSIRAKSASMNVTLLLSRSARRWTETELQLLGKDADEKVAHLTGRTLKSVMCKRTSLSIPKAA